MNLLETQINELDSAMTFAWEYYLDLHKELDKYRGRVIEDIETIKIVDELLGKIQLHFKEELYPIFKFVLTRNDLSRNACSGYEKFILSLKQAGLSDEANQVINGEA